MDFEILNALKLSNDFFHLNVPEDEEEFYKTPQFKYLRKIGYEISTIKSLNPGFGGKSKTSLKNYLLRNGVSRDIITELELDGDYSNRIIFTFYDKFGNIIGFSARTMEDIQINKNNTITFLNVPNKFLFIKPIDFQRTKRAA